MSPSAQRLGRRLLVWMVAAVASIENLANLVLALVGRRETDGWVWLSATLLVAFIAANIEKTKMFLEE